MESKIVSIFKGLSPKIFKTEYGFSIEIDGLSKLAGQGFVDQFKKNLPSEWQIYYTSTSEKSHFCLSQISWNSLGLQNVLSTYLPSSLPSISGLIRGVDAKFSPYMSKRLAENLSQSGLMLVKRKLSKEGKKLLLLAVVYNQEETDAHFCLARLYGEEAFFSIEYGLFHWCTFLKKFPNHTEGNMIVGDLYCKNDQPSLGRPYLEKHIHINPNSSKAYTLLGEIELLEKNFKVAKGYLLQALKIDNDYLPLYYPLITAYSLLENPIKCKAVLRLYLEKNPKDFVAYKMLGDIYLKLGELKKAKKSFKKALKLNPEEIQTYFKLGKVYERLGDLRKSNSILKKHTLWKEMRELHDGLLSTMGQNSRDSP